MSTVADTGTELRTIRTRVPARLDRLPWARFHWMIVLGLGTAWILDGIEVTIVGALGSRLTEHGSGISINVSQIGTAAAIYVIGACLGALFFGELTDRFGRKRLFMITLAIYMASTVLTAFSFAPWFFFLGRFLTGTGIGGEYAAINSAIDELIPARVRGRVDLIINGSYWLGSIAGSGAALFFLNTSIFAKDFGWRLAFGVGAVLGLAVLLVRRSVPESPRWLFIHGREEEAEQIVGEVEHGIEEETHEPLPAVTESPITVHQRAAIPFREIARVAVEQYPARSALCIALFIGQAFLYNGVVFNLGTLLTTFFAVASGTVPVFTILYAAGNFLGPLSLGRLFDTVGRKIMISATYFGSAAITVVLAILLLSAHTLTSVSFIAIVMVIFFLASAGASAAYLTASEIFPMETRALAIAFFYAVGTAAGGIAGPLLFGNLIATKQTSSVAVAFFIGAGVMAIGGIAEVLWGVKAEGMRLEDIARPLTATGVDGDAGAAPIRDETPTGTAPAGAATASAASGEEPEPSPQRTAARRERARAEEERATAAEHRAVAHERLAAGGDGNAEAERLATSERRLADIAESRARAHDERAAAADDRASAEHDHDGALAIVAAERAAAAEERADAYDREADGLAAEGDTEVERLGHLAAAARDRGRMHEQRALAAQARPTGGADGEATTPDGDPAAPDGDPGDPGASDADADADGDVQRARAYMHDLWAQMHEREADAHQRLAEHDEDAAAGARRAAATASEQARAAAYRVQAAEHRAEAERERLEDVTAEEVGRRREQAEQQRAAEAERQARVARRRSYEQAGLRRYRPGPGRGPTAPVPAVVSPTPDAALDDHIAAIAGALDEHGPTDRRELERLVGARYWGPGVFAEALREAIADGTVRRVARSVFALSDGDRAA